jgi:hypothetical protein
VLPQRIKFRQNILNITFEVLAQKILISHKVGVLQKKWILTLKVSFIFIQFFFKKQSKNLTFYI